MQRFDLNDAIYKSRPEWHTYQVCIQKLKPLTQRVIINSWEFPEIVHNNIPVTQLVVAITSNLGTTDTDPTLNLNHRASLLAGAGSKQIVFNKGENGTWVPVNGINSLNYVSKSMIFDFKLRMMVRGIGAINVPLSPKLAWKLDVSIV